MTRLEDFPLLTSPNDDSTKFCQWVTDNFDFNEDTLIGKNTTHTMGIISCISPKSDFGSYLKIPRKQTTPTELLQIAERSISLKTYKPLPVSMLSEVKLVSVQENLLPLDQFLFMDNLWLYSTLFTKQPPKWQGFMSQVVDGHFECKRVVFNPMVSLNPEPNLLVKEQARSAGMCCATLTFNQPLYLKANKIRYDSGNEFKSIYLRLGGFHQLMSFLGAGCKLFEVGGIEEIWSNVYKKNSIPKMIEGKTYSKCLRACLLTDVALHITLLHTDIESISKKEDK